MKQKSRNNREDKNHGKVVLRKNSTYDDINHLFLVEVENEPRLVLTLIWVQGHSDVKNNEKY